MSEIFFLTYNFFNDKSIIKNSCACNIFGLVYREITHIKYTLNLYDVQTEKVPIPM